MADSEPTEIAEEATSSGAGSGIEREAVDGAAAGGAARLDPERIEIQTRGMNIEQLLSRIRAKTIDLLPEARRERDGWSDLRRSRLVESLLLKIPLPPIYAVEDAHENWTVVDGMRRLTAVARFVDPDAIGQKPLALAGLEYLGDEFDGAAFEGLPPRMQRRLNETELTIHVIRHGTPAPVKFNIARRINTGGTTLSNQEIRYALIAGPAREVLRELAESSEFRKATANSIRDEGMADRELVLRFAAFRLTPYRDYEGGDFESFLGAAMRRLNELDAAPPEPVEPDVPEEPQVAEAPESAGAEETEAPAAGPPAESIEDQGDVLGGGEPDAAAPAAPEAAPEPEPAELPEPQPEPVTLARLERDFKEAMKTAAAIFGDGAFRKPHAAGEARNPVNRALFEAISVTLATFDAAQRKSLAAQSDSIKKDFIDLMQNSGFVNAISQDTGDPARVRRRFGEIEKLFEKALSCSTPSG
ncbi:MAG: DUF262 domain-containing protein [Alphaproteobacteria bacterium]|nr:DUF262 domain-containing protein [Alphaproteobacteria bacterium]